ncbi:MAG: hypothetical protein ACYDHY_07830 [Acidiferrobacterales bacterium]
MAKKWAKHTPKGAKLPDHVKEQLGPDNDEIPMQVEPNAPMQSQVTEQPHLDLHSTIGSEKFGAVDLRIERYPLPPDQRRELMAAQAKDGVMAKTKDGQWIVFGPGDNVKRANSSDGDLMKLPDDWEKYLLNVEDEGVEAEVRPSSEDQLSRTNVKSALERKTPSMQEVFRRKCS